jgi:hypothetical protein
MRALAAGLYALTAAAMVLGSGGLVVVPHREPLGTPAVHEHAVGALRFPILALGDAPGLPPAATLASHLRERHASHLRTTDGSTPTIEAAHALAMLAGAVILALLAFAFPRLPGRPMGPPMRAVLARPGATQWADAVTSPPPRVVVFSLS